MRFSIPGEPIPKGRPRLNRNTGTIYTPKTTRAYEQAIAFTARSKHERFGEDTVSVFIAIYTAKKDPPDGDNVFKSVCDALQQAEVIADDDQVVEGHFHLIHSSNPRLEVRVDRTQQRREE